MRTRSARSGSGHAGGGRLAKAELGARAYRRVVPRVVAAVVVCGGLLAVLAPITSGAPARSGGRAPPACSKETVTLGGERITLRFVLHGVSCNAGHRRIKTYFHDIATKTCRGRGTTCIFEYPGGWDCSSPPPSFPTSASHRFAVCEIFRGRPVASVTVYRVARNPGAPAHRPMSGHPPCTRQALVAGLRRGVRPLQGRLVRPWACAGRFAYAGLVVDGNEGTVLFRAVGRVWKPADRGKYCADGVVPARIYQPACNSN